ncbi:class I SAM-dependent methyltransferase [Paenibacillus oceani]|uniref:Methyltransferase domain-containing protein n=1 Tax=Paenibacillus oceani TaxID=2772510 RepID=A0A927CB55_9BACL|nr:methyltransferase domain-containing protein [Paenibacillus oceani]MBD2864809.1 methyltransferase domain-containing protein [Paenibacillus oceani]
MKIDVGCGFNKQPGYVGVDRYDTPDTKLICDFDSNIPIEDNSVEYIMASHSLEHANNLMKVMEELYRICKHKAIVCIVAPYHQTSLNMANPYHKQVFNEHTPRFFTKHALTNVSFADYYFPHAISWGLGESDNSNLQIDFRCVKMEFFYFPEYRSMSNDEKRRLRNTSNNIVDQIMYHLVVVKENISEEELDSISKGYLEEPVYVTIRKLREQCENLEFEKNSYQLEIDKLLSREMIQKQEKELQQQEQIQQHQEQIQQHQEQIQQHQEQIQQHQEQIQQQQEQIQQQQEQMQQQQERILQQQEQIQQQQEQIQQHQEQVVDNNIPHQDEMLQVGDLAKKIIIDLKDVLDELKINYKNKLVQREKEIMNLNDTYSSAIMEKSDSIHNLMRLHELQTESSTIYSEKIYGLWIENMLIKQGKLRRLINRTKRFFQRKEGDLSAIINEDCRDVVSQSILNTDVNLNNYILQLSSVIIPDHIIYYTVTPKLNGWSGIEVIFTNYSTNLSSKIMALEILSENNLILRTIFLDSFEIKHNKPTKIYFDQIEDSAMQKYFIRYVSTSPSIWGIQTYEWNKYNWRGTKQTVFCGSLVYN